MPITPLDVKTNLVGNNDVSRLRENQKSQEMGPAQQAVQNQNKVQEKFETVHTAESAEDKLLRKQDEEAERDKLQPDQQKKQGKEKGKEEEKEEPPKLPDPDRIRGMRIDLKA